VLAKGKLCARHSYRKGELGWKYHGTERLPLAGFKIVLGVSWFQFFNMSLATSLQELIPNARLGHYTIVEHVAEGGMGHVYRAFEPSLSREVAIKVLKAELADEPDKIGLFDMEAQNIAALRHANIVPIYFVGHQGDLHYFVMPFITGSTLDDWVESGAPMNADQAVWVLNQAVDALDWAYRHGIIHLDIKPSNFLVEDTGSILLTDFGLARTLGQTITDNPDECYGTPAYMCPEQILQQPTDQRSDIYSLGATMYHLMTCRFLYDCETVTELVQAHLEKPFPYSEAASLGLAPGWINLFDRMTQKSPADRFQNYEELKEAVANVTRLGPVKKKRLEDEAKDGLTVVPVRSSATKEYAYGILSPKFNSWAESSIDQTMRRRKSDTLNGLQKPMKPLRLSKLTKALKEMSKISTPEVNDLSEALAILPQMDEFVMGLAQTGFARRYIEGSMSRKKAIRVVGPDLVSQLILTGLMLRDDFESGPEFAWNLFWQHSISTGIVSYYLIELAMGEFVPGKGWQDPATRKMTSMLSLSNLLNKGNTSAYFAGLTHDIGKLALSEVAAYPYYSAMRGAIEKQTSLLEQEEFFMGMNHVEAGGLWMSWNGIDALAKNVATVHHELNKKSGLVGAAVALANQLVKIYGLGYSGSPIVDQRNLWETKAWAEVKASCKNDEITADVMEEHFVPLVGPLIL
jgi:serine/threonine protein kinase